MQCSTGLEGEAACPPVVFLHAGRCDAAGRDDVQLVLVPLQRRGACLMPQSPAQPLDQMFDLENFPGALYRDTALQKAAGMLSGLHVVFEGMLPGI